MEVGDEGEGGSQYEQIGDWSLGTSGPAEALHRLVAAHHQGAEDALEQQEKTERYLVGESRGPWTRDDEEKWLA